LIHSCLQLQFCFILAGKKNDRPAATQKDVDRINIPQRVVRQGGNPTQPQSVPVPKTMEKPATPLQMQQQEVWNVKETAKPVNRGSKGKQATGKGFC